MEDTINQIDGQVQIIFQKGEGNEVFCDALWMTQADYDATTRDTIEAMKQTRFDNWLAIINAPPSDTIQE